MFAKITLTCVTTLACGMTLTCGTASAAGLTSQAAALHGARPRVSGVTAAKPLPCTPETGGKLVWLGGGYSGDASVILVFWGSWWTTLGKPAESELQNLFTGLGNSTWARTVTQYCADGFRDAWPGNMLTETINDTSDPPAAPTESQLKAELIKQGIQQYGGSLVLVTPPGSVPAFDTKHGDCGHHSWFETSNGEYPWLDVPYGYIVLNNACGFSGGRKGALSIVAAHEWAEAVTDPFVNSTVPGDGWATSARGGVEVADLCQSAPSFNLNLSTGTFVMPQLWSNEAGKCVTGS